MLPVSHQSSAAARKNPRGSKTSRMVAFSKSIPNRVLKKMHGTASVQAQQKSQSGKSKNIVAKKGSLYMCIRQACLHELESGWVNQYVKPSHAAGVRQRPRCRTLRSHRLSGCCTLASLVAGQFGAPMAGFFFTACHPTRLCVTSKLRAFARRLYVKPILTCAIPPPSSAARKGIHKNRNTAT